MALNKVMLIGHLGDDPEEIAGGDGCKFSLATNERWKGPNGNQKERTEWHRVVCWGGTADACMRFLSKGRQVYVEGSIQTDEWEDQDGNDRKTKEIRAFNVQFLSTDSGGGGGRERKKRRNKKKRRSRSGGGGGSANPFGSPGGSGKSEPFDEDEIPF